MKIKIIATALFWSLSGSSQSQAQVAELSRDAPYETNAKAQRLAIESIPREDLVNFTLDGVVHRISDGDTVVLKGSNGARFPIRMSDIDTPEVEHDEFTPWDCKCKTIPFRPGQPGGIAATDALKSLITTGETVTAECYVLDPYGRMVCHLFKGEINVNLRMIEKGWGWLPDNPDWIRDSQSKVAEINAKNASKGAWGLSNQVSPSEWREQCWDKGECVGAEGG